jgi:hypothetical protein
MIDKPPGKRAERRETRQDGSGGNSQGTCLGAAQKITVKRATPEEEAAGLMEQVVERSNMTAALKRVESNGGASGVEEMSVDGLRSHLKAE